MTVDELTDELVKTIRKAHGTLEIRDAIANALYTVMEDARDQGYILGHADGGYDEAFEAGRRYGFGEGYGAALKDMRKEI